MCNQTCILKQQSVPNTQCMHGTKPQERKPKAKTKIDQTKAQPQKKTAKKIKILKKNVMK